ncbi:hypothetical protein NA57DRAFT_81098 [Rhizodiscina lignyota]|uniref:F-box domain-containing protein n=1 Tax=Rhizodiscina lignyota TaxID=1504668 RepID=A0A9P4M0G4_9PEZI|nr:hypothetical protein NA57DRAFT_81098 [Rhizodiscina lignyota]
MALTRLPVELLEMIITHALPEGFESMALTCRKIHAVCVPFIKRHNTLRSRFRTVTCHFQKSDPSFTIRAAFNLITCIADEPVAARYLRDADFWADSFHFTKRPTYEPIPDIYHPGTDAHLSEAVLRLLADSPYLEQAALDWKEYAAKIERELKDFRTARHYSQYAAAFLLTLLPNVETLTLPQRWKPVDATDKLINVIVHNAKQSNFGMPSLTQLKRFTLFQNPDWASPFLCLPHVRCFFGSACVAMSEGHKSIASKDLYRGFGGTLEEAVLKDCCIDEVGITNFLKYTPHLKTLRYSHMTNEFGNPWSWNICKFLTAIEREAGGHLVELSVSIYRSRRSISPGKASLRGFQCLQKLQLPLEVASCNINAALCQVTTPNDSLARSSTDHELNYSEPFIGDVIPASVIQVSLLSDGTDQHEHTLDIMFRHFAAKKKSLLPALKEIYLSCPSSATNGYKDRCSRLLAESEKGSVILHLAKWSSDVKIK